MRLEGDGLDSVSKTQTDQASFRLPTDGEHDVVVFLLDCRSPLERQLLVERVAAHEYRQSRTILLDASRDAVTALLDSFDEHTKAWWQPVRLAWLAGRTAGGRPRLRDVFFGEPGNLRQRWIARSQPDRIAVVYGVGASYAELKAAADDSKTGGDLAPLIIRRAQVSLERGERLLRGARYKIARLLVDDIFDNDAFNDTLASLANERGIEIEKLRLDAEKYLHEMGALQTPFTLDMMTTLERKVLGVNHDPNTDVDAAELKKIAALLNERPVVFLISHKSMLDIAAFLVVLYDANLPLPLTFGGINLNTPGFGAIARRAGIIFLRRSFQDNAVYKLTFRRYIDYLIEKRFSLQWALEGTRSRTGKLLPPRFGLFSYVVDSIARTGAHEVAFVPVSVGFDQITEVADYAREQRGHAKRPEGATWFLKFFRRKASHGRIFVRFGDPVAATDIMPANELNEALTDSRKTELVQSLAFRVAVNMNDATPITTSAIITLILLAGGKRAQSLAEIQRLARAGSAMIRRRKLEIVGDSDFRDVEQVLATLQQLAATGIVTEHTDSRENLYSISADQHHNAAYYRNTAIHFFVLDAIVEVALLRASAAADNHVEAFFKHASALRELLKFEFYFPRRADYRAEIQSRVDERFRNWQQAITHSNDLDDLVATAQPLLAHAVLRSFIDAYRIVARGLVELGDDPVADRSAFIQSCLPLGRQMLLQGRVFSAESVSKVLFETALRLAVHRRLLDKDQGAARSELLSELRQISSCLTRLLDITLAGVDDL